MATFSSPGKIADVINVFEDAVFADRGVFGSTTTQPRRRPRRETGLLDERDIELAIGRYVPAPYQREAAQALGVDHLVIIEGKRGLGKRAAAIAMLRDKTPGPLAVLSPASTMRELARHDYQSGNGYLVVDQAASKHVSHPDFAWHKVRDAVREAGAFLVVTRQEPIGEDVEMVTAVQWKPPASADVVRAHLAGAEHAVDELLATLPAGCSMTDIAKVAARVVAGDAVPDALRCLDGAAVDVVCAWFDAHRQHREILEVTALAFSTDATSEEFTTRLAALQIHVPDNGHTQLPSGPNSLVVTQSSGMPVFADTRYRDRVLAELCARQPRPFWDGASAWLEDVVRAGADLPVAFGLSGLAKADPLMVEARYLEPWSAGKLGWSGQTTAAFVLWAMCLDELLVSTALRIVRDWVRGSAAQRQTAALALSGELGVRFPIEAVHELRRLLSQGPNTGDDTYSDALGTLFGTLEAEGDDGTVVLGLLARLFDDAASPDAREPIMRSVLAALTASNRTDDEPAISSFLRDRPDRADLISRLTAPLLVDQTSMADALSSLLAAVADLKGEEIRQLMQSLPEAVATAQDSPFGEPTEPSVGTVPAAQPVPPPPADVDTDAESRAYPIIDRRRIEHRHSRVSRLLLGRQTDKDALPVTEIHETLVFHVDSDHMKDPGRRGRSRVAARASHISLVDMTARRPVLVPIAIQSAAGTPFTALIRFACTVVDPVLVVREGINNADRRLHNHLCSHHRLMELGRARHPHDLDSVRLDVTAWVRAFLTIRPMSWPGLTIELTSIDVLAPQPTLNPIHSVESDDAD